MNIVHFIETVSLKFGGPVRAVFDLCSGLCGRGHRVTVLTPDRGDAPPEWNGEDLSVPNVVGLSGGSASGLSAKAKEEAKSFLKNANIVHLHGIWSLANTWIASECRRAGTPYLVSPRGMLDDWSMSQGALKKRVFLKAFGHVMLDGASAVHCTAQAEWDQARRWTGRARGVVVPNLLNLDPFRHAPGPGPARDKFPMLREDRPRLLFLSRIHYKKGPEILLKAAALLKEKGCDTTAVLAGTGDEPYVAEMQKLAADLGLEDRTLWTGHVGGALKVSLYQACEVFALPTSQENFGFVFPEALASGTPVVTTRGVDIWPELLESGAAVIVERTPEAFAAALLPLLSDGEKLAEMRSAARPWAMRAFDEKSILDRFEAMYNSCLSDASAR